MLREFFAVVGVLATMRWLLQAIDFLERRSLDRLRKKQARSLAAAGKVEGGDG